MSEKSIAGAVPCTKPSRLKPLPQFLKPLPGIPSRLKPLPQFLKPLLGIPSRLKPLPRLLDVVRGQVVAPFLFGSKITFVAVSDAEDMFDGCNTVQPSRGQIVDLLRIIG